MKAIDKRIGISASGGFFLGVAIEEITRIEWVFTLIFFIIGCYLIYKARYY